jgi:hypothetical protein
LLALFYVLVYELTQAELVKEYVEELLVRHTYAYEVRELQVKFSIESSKASDDNLKHLVNQYPPCAHLILLSCISADLICSLCCNCVRRDIVVTAR